jgi:hypothetical protein
MRHPSEEELVLHFYGDAPVEEIRRHLSQCDECAAAFRRIEDFLGKLPEIPVPEPRPGWTDELWRTLDPAPAPAVRVSRRFGGWKQAMAAAACLAVVIAGAFLAGIYWAPDSRIGRSTPDPAAQRMLALVLEEHLARSQRLLLELTHSDDDTAGARRGLQEEARQLVSLNRLYRRAARQSGSPFIEQTLESLERTLLQVAHAPAGLNAGDFHLLLARLDTRDLLLTLQLVRRQLERGGKTPPSGSGQDKS